MNTEPFLLSKLSTFKLDPSHQRLFDDAILTNAGNAIWRSRKKNEIHDFLALAQVSKRIRIRTIDLSVDLRILFDFFCPVPTLPHVDQDLVIRDRATLGLTYTEDSVRNSKPGYSFLQILSPSQVWLPNVSDEEVGIQALCLGAILPPGILIKELTLLAYAALTMQSVQLDALDSAGVMNGKSAQWWKINQHRFPLTQDSFIPASKAQST
tara:strand:+ start:386 stop:1015 length:630 start_codon:yes stop_codon:yes gene_type:complete